ncbi:PIG-M-domain-containing protein [Cyathus striatus]|nr:PIG-M-domain-containing protein [Cyathus striatus]
MTLSLSLSSIPSFRAVLIISVLIRVILVLYSEWHDARSVVKYTDVDYRVFSDAAYFIAHPSESNLREGTRGVVRPYTRDTYRYTPLLALLLTPNTWLHPSFGKYLFSACDIINGIIIYRLLVSDILPQALGKTLKETLPLATIYTSTHLLNPMVFSISTRGSSESVLSLFVLLTLYMAMKQRWIYPVIYGVACLGAISSQVGRGWMGLVNGKTAKFAVVSAGTFVGLGAGCYAIWGYPFLYESYIYHLHRLDHRHNFSPYFYLTYLIYPSLSSPLSSLPISLYSRFIRSPLTSFLPQLILSFEDLPFTWFVQTFVFVVFNKVCTSQVPAAYLIIWIGTQALWLSEAYRLEFLGHNVYFGLWIRGLVYVIGNCWVLGGIMHGYRAGVLKGVKME